MKNTVSQASQPVSKKTEREHVQPTRVSDMGMGMKASKEIEKKQPIAAATV